MTKVTLESIPISSCGVIIVTYNSQLHFSTCLEALKKQTRLPSQIIVVDNGSDDTAYLEQYKDEPRVNFIFLKENLGFCQGNNIGFSYLLPTNSYVLFLNPDAFLTPTFIEEATEKLEEPAARHVGAISGLLLGYNIQKQQPTNSIDSAGIFRTWYGRWYDRGQGQTVSSSPFKSVEKVPALCGALMFCRFEALKSVELGSDLIMDPNFFMYKEDIDLSLRLRQKGWSLLFMPHLLAYHCRGWNRDRSQVPRHLRLLSAKNEMRLYARMRSPCYFYSLLKYFLVKIGNC